MACTSCASGGCATDTTNATGGCGGGCSTGGCNKMNSYDWLSNMEIPADQRFDIVEVRFKNGRKEFFRNIHRLELFQGTPIVVDAGAGYHLGTVALQGELVRLQMLKKNIKEDDEEIRVIYRVATEKDLEKYKEVKAREMPTMFRARQIIQDLKLDMKLSDVEYQSDNTKATFYFSAETRVDFRELIKLLAGEFKIRVEMRQISLRQEAGRLGGIGVCGRELCCSTWLSDFKNVATSAARYQNLSLNPTKLSGQCGRLKCCLNYELDTYKEALRHIPNIEKPLLTRHGQAYLRKTDIFKKIMWFGYDSENNWYPLTIEQVKVVLEMNTKGEVPESLSLFETKPKQPIEKSIDMEDDLGELREQRKAKREEEAKRKKKKKKKPKDKEAARSRENVVPKATGGEDKGTPKVPNKTGEGRAKKRPFRKPNRNKPS